VGARARHIYLLLSERSELLAPLVPRRPRLEQKETGDPAVLGRRRMRVSPTATMLGRDPPRVIDAGGRGPSGARGLLIR